MSVNNISNLGAFVARLGPAFQKLNEEPVNSEKLARSRRFEELFESFPTIQELDASTCYSEG